MYASGVLLFVLFIFVMPVLLHDSMTKNKDLRGLAKEKVIFIQGAYNNSEFLEVYNLGTDGFKKSISEGDFTNLMNIHKKVLGELVKSKLLAIKVINSNVVILTYRADYKNYSLVEEYEFTNKNKDNALQLSSHFIDDGGVRGEVIKY